MAKTISLPPDIYEALKNRKRENESFAQLIQRLLGINFLDQRKEADLLSFIGVFADDNEWDTIEEQIYSNRARIRKSTSLFDDNEVN